MSGEHGYSRPWGLAHAGYDGAIQATVPYSVSTLEKPAPRIGPKPRRSPKVQPHCWGATDIATDEELTS